MIKTYEAIYTDEGQEEGVFSISLVKDPAYKSLFIQLSAQQQKEKIKNLIQFKTVDEKEHLLIGVVLKADVPIYRSENGFEFNVIFPAETIKKVAYNFFKKDYHKNSTIEHDKEQIIKGIAFVESWLVRDPKKDIAAFYDIKVDKGDWLVGMKVDEQKVWDDYIETGVVKGFSIDAFVKLKEVEPTEKVEMSVVKTLKKISADFLVALKLKNKPKFTQIKLAKTFKFEGGEINMEGGEVTFEFEGEILEAGVNIFAVDPQDPETKIKVPPGTYPLEDGRVLIITEEGIVGEVKEKIEPGAKPPTPDDMNAGDDGKAIQKIQSILIKYEDRFKKIDKLVKDVEEMKKEVLTFSEQSREKPSTPDPVIDLNANGEMLKIMRDNN